MGVFRRPLDLLVVQEWRSLPIITDNSAFLSDTAVLAKHLWSPDDQGENKQAPCDDEGKDPLESNNLDCKLTQSESFWFWLAQDLTNSRGILTQSENGQLDAHCVILEGEHEKGTED